MKHSISLSKLKPFCLTLLPVLFTAAILILFCFSADESRTPLTLKGDILHREAGSLDGTTVLIAEDSGYVGDFVSTKNFMLRKGDYRIGVAYRTDQNAVHTLSIQDNGQTRVIDTLSADQSYMEFPISLAKDSQDLTIHLDYSGTGSLAVDSLTLIPVTRFYNDAYFYAFLIFLVTICFGGLLWYRNFAKEGHFLSSQAFPISSQAIVLVLLGITFVASLPYLNGYLNWGDDICYHLIRIEGIKDGLADGQFPVILYPEGMQGNGYLNCMYPNLFLYFPALLRLLGVSLIGSYKALAVLFHLLTAFVTYYSVHTICHNKKAALLAAILYTLCPYRMTNFYARGAVGEALAMTFFPLLFAGLYHVLLGDIKKYGMLVLGLSGLMETHVLSALLGSLFCVLFGMLCLPRMFSEKRFLTILKAALLTLLLNLWFLVPFLYFYCKGDLNTSALDWSTFTEYALNFSGLFGSFNPNDYRTLSLGLPIAFCSAICLLYFLLEKQNTKTASQNTVFFAGFLAVLGVICTFLVTSQFSGWEFMNITLYDKFFRNIQFAWRMLGPASVTLILAGCILLYQSKLLTPYRQGIFIALTAICLFSAIHYQPEDFAYASYDATYSTGLYSKLNGIPKGENTIVYPYEWAPDDFPVTDLPTAVSFTNADAVTLSDYERTGTTTTFTYTNQVAGNLALLPITAYAGYQAVDETGAPLTFQENREKRLALPLADPDGKEHKIVVNYKGMVGFTIAFLISVLTVVVWAIHFCLKMRVNHLTDKAHI